MFSRTPTPTLYGVAPAALFTGSAEVRAAYKLQEARIEAAARRVGVQSAARAGYRSPATAEALIRVLQSHIPDIPMQVTAYADL